MFFYGYYLSQHISNNAPSWINFLIAFIKMIAISAHTNYAQKKILIKTHRLDAFDSKKKQSIEKGFGKTL